MPDCNAKDCKSRRTGKRKNKIQLKWEHSHGKKISFHRIPMEPQQRQKWLDAMELYDSDIPKNAFLCSLHFKENDLDRTSLACTRVRSGAIPLKNLSMRNDESSAKRQKMLGELIREVENLDSTKTSKIHDDAEKAEMVRTCKVNGCNVREGQKKQLFRFPKDPERRSIWVSRTGRKFWQPGASSCICEDHFDASQWETVRVDGSRVLRRFAVPLPAENSENVSLTMHDHGYAVGTSRRHSSRDLTAQVNRSVHDHGYASVQSEPSRSTQAVGSQVIARTSNIAVECTTSGYCNSDGFNPLPISADICAASEPVHISQSTATPASIKIKELQDQLKKQKEEIKVLQHDNKLLNTIVQKVTKKFYAVTTYDKCRFRLWCLEQNKAKSQF